jgi:hypothetical protein
MQQLINYFKSHEQSALQGLRVDWKQVCTDIVGELQKRVDSEAAIPAPTETPENGPETA